MKGKASEKVTLKEWWSLKGGLFEWKPEGDGVRRSDLNRGEGWSLKGGLFERKPEGDGFRRSDLNRGEGWSWKRGFI